MRYFQKQPPDVFCRKGCSKNFPNFTGKHLCWSLFLMKLQAFKPAHLLKRDSNTGVSLRKLRKFFKSTYSEVHLQTTASVFLTSKLQIM